MNEGSKLKRGDLIYSALSYQIIGILFEVYKELGSGYHEKYYQRAIGRELRKCGLQHQEQVPIPLKYKNEKIGSYFLDFLIDNKIVLEIKKDNRFAHKNIEQVYAYLKATGLKLGIIAAFTRDGVKFRRILNIR